MTGRIDVAGSYPDVDTESTIEIRASSGEA
jgi:hypothetical protein